MTSEVCLVNAKFIQHGKINHVNNYVSTLKKKSHTVSPGDAEKTLNKIQHLFMIKTFSKLEIERNIFDLKKNIYKKPTVDVLVTSKN
jgi:hypothetical protein